MSSDWTGLEQFTEQMRYWTDVHQYLIAHSQTGNTDVPLFGLPYLDANRLIVPDYPGNGPSAADAWRWYSIIHDGDQYTLVSSGFDRGNTRTDVPTLSSPRFDYAAKYFLVVYVAEHVRSATSLKTKPEIVSTRFADLGLAEGWESLPDLDPTFTRSTRTNFRHSQDPDGSRYVAASYQIAPTFYLDRSWYEISRMCAEGIPGIDHIPIPGAPGAS